MPILTPTGPLAGWTLWYSLTPTGPLICGVYCRVAKRTLFSPPNLRLGAPSRRDRGGP